jgi:hypothetical protein
MNVSSRPKRSEVESLPRAKSNGDLPLPLLLLSPLPLQLLLSCHCHLPFAIAVGIEPGFSPASKPAAKRPTALPKAGAKPAGRSDLNIAFVFAVVPALAFFFRVFSPKSACQAPKPPNSLKQKTIELAC